MDECYEIEQFEMEEGLLGAGMSLEKLLSTELTKQTD